MACEINLTLYWSGAQNYDFGQGGGGQFDPPLDLPTKLTYIHDFGINATGRSQRNI